MKLAQALGIQPGDVVALVGAGGKTTSLFCLANELVEQGQRVITTTTTRIAQDELPHAPQHIRLDRSTRLPETFPDQLEEYRHMFIFSSVEGVDKVRGVPPAWLDRHLASAPHWDVLLVEADGSRRLPLKAPYPHEPAIPTSATVAVPMAGMDALGQPLDEQHIYGAEIIHEQTGHVLGDPVSSQLVADVLSHPQLGLKNIPPRARIAPLLNKVTSEGLASAHAAANRMLSNLDIECVLIGAVRESDPIREVRRRVGAVILAAGESRRMGQPKLLLPWGDSTIIRQVCQHVVACSLYETVVVAGQWVNEIQAQIADLSVRVVHNPDHAQGEIRSSLQTGLQAIWQTSSVCLVVLGDQPAIEQTTISSVTQAYYEGRGRIVAPSYAGRRGHPILIDRAFWQAVMDLPPGAAPRDVLSANAHEVYHVVVETDTVLRDIDTPGDYRRERGDNP